MKAIEKNNKSVIETVMKLSGCTTTHMAPINTLNYIFARLREALNLMGLQGN